MRGLWDDPIRSGRRGRRELVTQCLISFQHHALLSLGSSALYSDGKSEAQQVNLLIQHPLVRPTV